MAEKSPNDLELLRDEQLAIVNSLEATIAELTLDGAGEVKLAKVREKINASRARASELDAAANLAKDRAETRRKAEASSLQRARLGKAISARGNVLEAAGNVDTCLAALDHAQETLRLKCLDLSSALRIAGLANGGRLQNGLIHSTRWAAYQHAPTFSADARIPRVEMHRRCNMADSIANLIPFMGDQPDA